MTTEGWKTYAGYCINDVDITFAAFKTMWAYFPSEELAIIDMTLQMFIHPKFVLDTKEVQRYRSQLLINLEDLIRLSGVAKTTLASNQKFAAYLERHHNIIVPIIPSPTIKNPDNTKLALSKGDLEFIEMRKAHPELNHIWDARLCVKSTGEINRTERLLKHAEPTTKTIAVPLKYYGAHTGRWSGTNRVNFQNFKRNSPIRYSLHAPEGYKILVRDLANIEGRMNAWFNQQHDKCNAFAEGRDLYNEIAEEIFGYPVDRKKKVQDAQGNYLDISGGIVGYEDAAYLQFMEGFTGKTAELGLGYGMGATKFRHQCAVLGDILFDHSFTKSIVDLWRTKNYKIHAGWRLGDRAIFDMASYKMTPYDWHGIRVERGRLVLPNGLALNYPDLKHVTEDGQSQFTYWNGQYYKSLYGGLLMENIIQALSRITMSTMMLKINSYLKPMGGKILLTVHDEIVPFAPDAHAAEAFEYMGEVMSTPPSWANDGYLTLTSEGGIAQNYSK
jgi:DNA polymerase bacteriophage-type